MIASTSIEAYDGIYNLTGKRLEVYKTIKEIEPASNQAIADRLNWPINRVTGRVSELRDMGLVEQDGSRKGKFGARVNTWRLKRKEKAFNTKEPETMPMFDLPKPVDNSPPKRRWRKEKAF